MSNGILETRVMSNNKSDYEKIVNIQKIMPQAAFDIEELCDQMEDISLHKKVLEDRISGVIVKEGSGKFAIYVNSNQPETRQRFTIAHEIAHFFLHKDKLGDKFPENMLFRGDGMTNKEETAANKLAAEILMPYEAIDSYIEGNNGSFTIRSLARVFNVSSSAMAIRLGIPID